MLANFNVVYLSFKTKFMDMKLSNNIEYIIITYSSLMVLIRSSLNTFYEFRY